MGSGAGQGDSEAAPLLQVRRPDTYAPDVPAMNALFSWALSWLQDRCPHPSRSVVADILEGEILPVGVQWCRICGAWRRYYNDAPVSPLNRFRSPRPRWER